MQKRTSLSFTLSPNQKAQLLDHCVWSVDSLSENDKNYISEKLQLGTLISSKKQFIVPSETYIARNIEYRSGFSSIDAKISPFLPGVVTEICGLPGSGRTTFCMRYAANLPDGLQTLWIDTEGALTPPKNLSLNVIRPLDFLMLFALIYQIPKIVDDMGQNLGLIVIDSIAALLRGQNAAEISGERTNMLWEMIRKLKEIAVERGIAVLLTNHMSMTIFHGTTRTLGNSWSHAPTHCFEIKKYNSGRTLKILKSPCIPKIDIPFLNEDEQTDIV